MPGDLLRFFLELALGFIYANAGEWSMHKYVLHGLGKHRRSFWAYHLYGHHVASSQNAMFDPGYQRIDLSQWNAQTKELWVLFAIVLIHIPLFLVAPVFTWALYGSLGVYYFKHRKAHLDPAWARRHLRWHYDHHLGPAAYANWCVSWPWFDYLLGTRVQYEGLEKTKGDVHED